MTAQLSSGVNPRVNRIGRFGLVGAANTAIDLAVTNLLGLLLPWRGPVTIALIGVIACIAASVNSYLLNRHWTFRDAVSQGNRRTFVRFAGVVMIGLVINTSVFLFCHQYMQSVFHLPDLLLLNLSKLAGVMTAMGVTFVGYRFGVFRNQSIVAFRETFRFSLSATRASLAIQALTLAGAATAVRLGYLCLTTAVFGDAVNYAKVARGIATGGSGEIDTFWSSLFCFWEAGFHLAGFSPTAAAVGASLAPGILLVVAVTWLTRSLYGPTAGWIGGIVCCVHPRLVEYSCNGYAESFYLLAFTIGIACLTRVIQQGSILPAAGWGAALGVYACVRNEAILLFVLSLPLALLIRAPQAGFRTRIRRASLPAGVATASFAAVTLLYAGASQATMGTWGIFQKGANLNKQFSEQLDARQAAREAYGRDGKIYGTSQPVLTWAARAVTLVHRYPRNLYYTLQRLPGVLLSPLPVFMMLLPMFTVRRGRAGGDEWPLILMIVFPLAFYPCIQVEPRLLFPLLVPMHVFGAAGIVAVCAYLSTAHRRSRLTRGVVVATAVSACLLTTWRGRQVESAHTVHRALAEWLAAHAAPGDVVVGCGYGHVTTTAFLSQQPGVPRIWTDDPASLAHFVSEKHGRWLILYESFIRNANPELLETLDSGVPGFERAYVFRDGRGLRSQILRLKEKT